MALTITSADATLTLTQATLFPTPQHIQQFAADDVFDTDAIRLQSRCAFRFAQISLDREDSR